mmetsp:Transcript_56675/g.184427  ORF Transcript_56675/g.184427 Transcript_56675/m.184427 type:complete len:213 (+) Transcript_56675:1347-1985(+)
MPRRLVAPLAGQLAQSSGLRGAALQPTEATGVHHCEVVLSQNITGPSSTLVAGTRPREVWWHARETLGIEHTEVAASREVAFFRGLLKPQHGFPEIPGETLACNQVDSQAEHEFRVAQRSTKLAKRQCRRIVLVDTMPTSVGGRHQVRGLCVALGRGLSQPPHGLRCVSSGATALQQQLGKPPLSHQMPLQGGLVQPTNSRKVIVGEAMQAI